MAREAIAYCAEQIIVGSCGSDRHGGDGLATTVLTSSVVPGQVRNVRLLGEFSEC